MNLTKEQIILINHALDCMVRAEAQGAAQGGLDAVKKNNAASYIGGRLVMAVELSVALEFEFARLVEEEQTAAAAAEAEKAAAEAAPTIEGDKPTVKRPRE